MLLEIAHIDRLHELATKAKEIYREKKSAIALEEDDQSPIFPRLALKTYQIDVFPPLETIQFCFHTQCEHYAAAVIVAASNPKCFTGLSTSLKSKIQSHEGYVWCPRDTKGVGYIIKDKTPFIAISRFSSDTRNIPNGRIIAIGNLGAEPRQIEDDENEFAYNINQLRLLSNVFVNACYEKSRQHDISLFLDCLI